MKRNILYRSKDTLTRGFLQLFWCGCLSRLKLLIRSFCWSRVKVSLALKVWKQVVKTRKSINSMSDVTSNQLRPKTELCFFSVSYMHILSPFTCYAWFFKFYDTGALYGPTSSIGPQDQSIDIIDRYVCIQAWLVLVCDKSFF